MGIPDLVEGTCPAVACPAGAPISSRRNGGKERPGASFFEVASLGFSSKAPPAPSTLNPGEHGGSALCSTRYEPGVHCRPTYWRSRDRRCRAWAARVDHPAKFVGGCAGWAAQIPHMVSALCGSPVPHVGRGIPDAPFTSRRGLHDSSEARHRRRPGGPSWYSAAAFRACGVTAMRATRGAAAPVT